MKKNRTVRWYIPVLGIACALALSRVCSVLYPLVAGNVVYEEGPLPSLLYGLKAILAAVAFGIGAGAVLACTYRRSERYAARLVGWHMALLLVDTAAAALLDISGGQLEGEHIPQALFVLGGSLLWEAVIVLTAYLLRTAKTVWAPTLVYLSARLLSCTVYVLRFLGEVEYRPYREEIVSMLLDYLLVLVSAATVYLVARITSRRA